MRDGLFRRDTRPCVLHRDVVGPDKRTWNTDCRRGRKGGLTLRGIDTGRLDRLVCPHWTGSFLRLELGLAGGPVFTPRVKRRKTTTSFLVQGTPRRGGRQRVLSS